MENNSESSLSKEAICFNQPVFGDYHRYPGLGSIELDTFTRLTWIVGEKHFAVIVGGEVRYCGTQFPYMTLDPRTLPAHPILIGSNGNGKKFFRSIQVSQLRHTPKVIVQEGALDVITRRSNNILANIHPLVTLHYGENYWFNGCARYVMECLGEPALDYWFFSGLTGDNLAQVYSYDRFRGDSATDYRLSDGDPRFIELVFQTCGYAAAFISEESLCANRQMYLQTLIAYIDKGIPVIINLLRPFGGEAHGFGWGVFVGYEDYGKCLLCLTADKPEPLRIPIDVAVPESLAADAFQPGCGWVFVGEKKKEIDINQIYRDTVLNMPRLLTTKTQGYCFGAEAFRAWAADIENGGFEDVTPEAFNDWTMYKIYVCNVATNGSCRAFLERALARNPDLTFLSEVLCQFKRLAALWNGSDGQTRYAVENLESVGGGFNVTLEALRDKQKRAAIAAILRACADCYDALLACFPKETSV